MIYMIEEAEAEGDWEFEAEVECECGNYEAVVLFEGHFVGDTAFSTYTCPVCSTETSVTLDIGEALDDIMRGEA
jgi:hypothetical protein